MDRKKKFLVSSTPHLGRNREVLQSLFSDSIQCSPISVPQIKEFINPQPIPSSSAAGASQQTKGVKKRRVASKAKAAPESATAEVLQELGVETQDLCNNALSHSRNLYNMFPQPIILDSDDESSVVVKKTSKQAKQDSSMSQSISTRNQEEKKTKAPVPGSSRTSRLARSAPETKLKVKSSIIIIQNQYSYQSKRGQSSAQTSDVESPKRKTKKKRKPPNKNSPSVLILDDDDDDNAFPEYHPGTSTYKTVTRNKVKDKVRLSLELDENFPIEWKTRSKKPVYSEHGKVANAGDIEAHTNEDLQESENKQSTVTHTRTRLLAKTSPSKALLPKFVENVENKVSKKNIDTQVTRGNKTSNNGMDVVKLKRGTRNKVLGTKEVLTKSGQKRVRENGVSDNGEEENQLLISRFEEILFRSRSDGSGIIASGLETKKNQFGYLEVPENEVFHGKKINITYVVLEGEARFNHLGAQHTVSTGDMIHITDGSGYSFTSLGTRHVRFLYVKE